MAASALVMLAEAERAIGALCRCAGGRLARCGFCGGMHDLAVTVDVVLVVLQIALGRRLDLGRWRLCRHLVVGESAKRQEK